MHFIVCFGILEFLENIITLKSTTCEFKIEKLSSQVHMPLTFE